MAKAPNRVLIQRGGNHAPALPPERLPEYKAVVETFPDKAKFFCLQLIHMLEVFFQTPESTETPVANRHNMHAVIPLTEEEKARIWDVVPYHEEIEMMAPIIYKEVPDGPKGSDAWKRRQVAAHLVWYARELEKDREPVTRDKLPEMRALLGR